VLQGQEGETGGRGGGQGVNAVCRHSCLMSVTEQESAQAAKPGMPTPNGRVCAGVRMR
jgi:hypothetical protein